MLITPAPMFLGSGSIVFPAVTVGRADIGGLGFYGYVRPGGPVAGAFGASGGTLSGTIVTGYVTDGVVYDGDQLGVTIMGDCTALLAGVTALMDNGTPLPLLYPAAYISDIGATAMSFDGSWTSTGNRTIQLV